MAGQTMWLGGQCSLTYYVRGWTDFVAGQTMWLGGLCGWADCVVGELCGCADYVVGRTMWLGRLCGWTDYVAR